MTMITTFLAVSVIVQVIALAWLIYTISRDITYLEALINIAEARMFKLIREIREEKSEKKI